MTGPTSGPRDVSDHLSRACGISALGLLVLVILLAVLIAPFLRKLGVRTVPHFMAARYGGLARFLALIILVVCSSIFVIALLQGAVAVAMRALGANSEIVLAVVLAVILLCTVP